MNNYTYSSKEQKRDEFDFHLYIAYNLIGPIYQLFLLTYWIHNLLIYNIISNICNKWHYIRNFWVRLNKILSNHKNKNMIPLKNFIYLQNFSLFFSIFSYSINEKIIYMIIWCIFIANNICKIYKFNFFTKYFDSK